MRETVTVSTSEKDVAVRTNRIAEADATLEARWPMVKRATLRSFAHASDGLRYALHTQANVRVHFVIGVGVLLAGNSIGLSLLELAIVGLTICLVIFAELTNTVVEVVVDLVTSEYHPLAKVAKDVAAGAVLWTALMSVVTGVLVMGPHLIRLFNQSV